MTRSIKLLLLAFFSLLMTKAALADTWYVRADGGTRYSANATSGQCDGKGDAAYPGSGVNQHCAFSDYRFLYDDQHSYNKLQWAIAGGDTVILDNTKPWRVGWDGDGTNPSAERWCWGWDAGPYGCNNPTIPAGTAQQHTRILGRNWANCNAGNQADRSKLTQIFGGHAVGVALNLSGAQYVDVQCIELTRHSNCIRHGYPAYPSNCNSSYPLDDYDGDGIYTDTHTHDVLLQDMWIHGHTDRGIIGPIGGLVTANRINISTNGMAGWDFDDGNGTPNVNGVLKMSYSVIEWSGCNQEYPAVDPIPVASCYSQSTGGYGDGIGTPAGDAMNVYIDHSIFRYNTQDGEDFGHIDSGSNTLQITNSASYANNGGQFKWGGNFTNVVFENNIAVADCLRMSQPLAGAPSSYNAHLADFCRAQDALSFDFRNGGQALFANNTVISYAPTTFDVQCWDSSCANTVFTLTNNVVRGYVNQATWNMGGQGGGVGGFCGAWCNGSSVPIGTMNRSNNIFYGVRGTCIANTVPNFALGGTSTGESCADPGFENEPNAFIDETTLDGYDFALTNSSPARYAGTPVTGLAADYDGNLWHNAPSAGALEVGSAASLLNLTNWPVPPPSNPGGSTGSSAAPLIATQTMLSVTKGSGSPASFVFTAVIIPASGSPYPSGTVTLYSGSKVIATASTTKGIVDFAIPANFTKLTVNAVYSGSSIFAPSTSNTVTVTAKAAGL